MQHSRRSLGGLIALVTTIAVGCGGAATPTPSTASAAPTPSTSAVPTTSAAPSASASGSWTAVAPEGGGFTVDMPGRATFATQSVTTPLGDIDLHLASFIHESGTYAATWSDYPAGSITDPAASLVGARDGAVANIGGQLVTDAPIQREGLPGHAFTATIAGGVYQAEVFLQGDRMIQLVLISEDEATELDKERFFESFQLTG